MLFCGGFLAGCQRGGDSAAQAASKRGPAPATPVTVAVVERRDLPVYLGGLGSLAPSNSVMVRSRVDGELVSIDFREGQEVKKGDILAQIDPRPFQVSLEQARGNLAKDAAQLNNARTNLARSQALYDEKVIAKQEFDTQAAAVNQFLGAIEADNAQIDSAKLQLSYATIVAPEDGRIGLRLVDPGNMVHAADAQGLLAINKLQPIAVLFTLPADSLPAVLKRMRSGDAPRFELFSRDGATRIGGGALITVDNQIDQQTGTFRLKGEAPNESRMLWPNQFVNVRLLISTKRNAVVAPASAVQRGNAGTFLYVVKADNTAEMRNVTVGLTQGEIAVIDSGVAAGERVVVDGQDKLQTGMKVNPRG